MLTMNVIGVEALNKKLGRLDLGSQEMRRLLTTLAESVITQTKFRFREEKGPDGAPWKESYRARVEGGQTLTDNAHLKNSLTRRVTDRQAEVFPNEEYAAIHQFGGIIRPKSKKALRFKVGGKWATKKSVTMPARPFMGFGPADEQELIEEVDDFIRRRLAT